MNPSRTLDVGGDGHQDASAVASGSEDQPPPVVFLGAMGTRPGDSAQLLRQLPAKRTPLVLVDEAGPCGSGL
jgi:hypothetical protein